MQRPEVDAGEAVEGPPLRLRPEQLLVGVLTVELDQAAPVLGELGDRDRSSVDVGPAPTVGRDDA